MGSCNYCSVCWEWVIAVNAVGLNGPCLCVLCLSRFYVSVMFIES